MTLHNFKQVGSTIEICRNMICKSAFGRSQLWIPSNSRISIWATELKIQSDKKVTGSQFCLLVDEFSETESTVCLAACTKQGDELRRYSALIAFLRPRLY